MRCINCGFENEQNFEFCPNCGTAARPDAVSLNPAADKILRALKDNLFLVICILMSVSCGLSVISGGIPLINILTTIFLWLTYSQSRKNIADSKYLRYVSGTVYAGYVINYVLFALIFVAGVLLAAVFGFVTNEPDLLNAITGQIGVIDQSYIGIVEQIFSIGGWVIMVVFALSAILGVLINALGMRKIHRLAKSAYQSIEMCNLNLEKANAAKNWLFVYGVFEALGAAASLIGGAVITGITNGSSAAAIIIAGVLVQKRLLSAE